MRPDIPELRIWGLSAIRAGRKKRVGNSRCSTSGGWPIMKRVLTQSWPRLPGLDAERIRSGSGLSLVVRSRENR